MQEESGVGGGDRPNWSGPLDPPQQVSGLPIWTHLIAGISFPLWSIGTQARLYGIDARDDWWEGFGNLATSLLLVVLVVAMPPAVALEAWSVMHRRPWAARTAVVTYVLIAGLISFVPTGLRFFGDATAIPMDLVMLSLSVFIIVICSQALSVYLLCRLWACRRAAG
jgi:hypothetical protein